MIIALVPRLVELEGDESYGNHSQGKDHASDKGSRGPVTWTRGMGLWSWCWSDGGARCSPASKKIKIKSAKLSREITLGQLKLSEPVLKLLT